MSIVTVEATTSLTGEVCVNRIANPTNTRTKIDENA